MTIGPESEDYDLRFQVADPNLSDEQEQLHAKGMRFLQEAMVSGRTWSQASGALDLGDVQIKEVVLADYLKVLLAQRHFQAGERLKGIAKELGLSMDVLISLKSAMLQEVREASERAYRLTQSQSAEN